MEEEESELKKIQEQDLNRNGILTLKDMDSKDITINNNMNNLS